MAGNKLAPILLSAPLALAASRCVAAEDTSAIDFTPSGWLVMLSEAVRSFDVVGFFLLVLVVILIGMTVDMLAHLRIGRLVPEGLLGGVQEEMTNGEYEKALDLCEKSDCLIGQIFAAALSKTDYSFERMEQAMRGELEIQSLVWRQWVRQFRAIIVMGPLAGLAGAVVNAMRLVADLTGRPNIGLALASSFEMRSILYNICSCLFIGLLMALIAMIVYAYANSKLEKILVESRRLGEELLDPFRPLPTGPEE